MRGRVSWKLRLVWAEKVCMTGKTVTMQLLVACCSVVWWVTQLVLINSSFLPVLFLPFSLPFLVRNGTKELATKLILIVLIHTARSFQYYTSIRTFWYFKLKTDGIKLLTATKEAKNVDESCWGRKKRDNVITYSAEIPNTIPTSK